MYLKMKKRMNRKSFFGDPLIKFTKTGEAITKRQIDRAIPEEFVGKEDFVSFYVRHNGGVLSSAAFFYRDKFRKLTDRDMNMMSIVDFLRIFKKGSSAVEQQLSIGALRAASRSGSTNQKQRNFLDSRIPFAGDGSGNYYWIEIPSGRIQFVDHESVGSRAPRPIKIAPTFIDFVSNFQSEPRDEDKLEL